MPNYSFSLNQFFGLGTVTVRDFDSSGEGLKTMASMAQIEEQKYAEWDEREMTSYLGTPVKCSIKLIGKKEFSYGDKSELLLTAVLAEVDLNKNITVTPMSGRRGTFKEIFSTGDFSVRIRGLVVGETESYPKESVETLISILTEDNEIEVQSSYLRMFGIHNLAVTSFKFPQTEGLENAQMFEFQSLSDEPIEITEKEESSI